MEGSVPKTIDEYIERYPKNIQTILKKFRSTIRKAAPEANEAIRLIKSRRSSLAAI